MSHLRIDLTIYFICLVSITILPCYSCKKSQNVTEFTAAEIEDCDSIVVTAGEQYKAGKVHRMIFGDQYRKEWSTPIKVPCLKMSTTKGGFEIIKLGGGRQTKSLRVKTSDDIQYNIRSINKNPEALLPKPLRNTFLKDIVQDMISTAHPYGAMVVPKLAEAAGIHHTKPELYFVPYTFELGEYKEAVGGMLAMIEIRPDEDLSGFDRFGNSKNVVGTEKLNEKLRESSLNKVDEELYIRTRLFDMFLNDWDRHEDQWRWAEFEQDERIIFEPVPRDRDQVFVKMEGAFPYIVSRKWGVRNIRNFGKRIDDVEGINLNARLIDRILINELPKEEWLRIARELKHSLTDTVIVHAVHDLPPEIFRVSGEELISKLISRRNTLVEVANEYYHILAKKVNVIGSDEYEAFHIEQKNDRVHVYMLAENGQKIYERTFYASETKTIVIHPLGNNDRLYFSGENNSKITIEIYTGDGDEEIINNTNGKEIKNIKLEAEPSEIYLNRVYRG